MNTDDFEKQFFHGISGIKRTKKQVVLTSFNWENPFIAEIETNKIFVPGEGIVEVTTQRESIFDCGHSSSHGIGQVPDCGHTVCGMCVQKFPLRCHSCFKNLCTVKGCKNSAKLFQGIFFCKKHWFFTIISTLIRLISSGIQRTIKCIKPKREKLSLTEFNDIKRYLSDGK